MRRKCFVKTAIQCQKLCVVSTHNWTINPKHKQTIQFIAGNGEMKVFLRLDAKSRFTFFSLTFISLSRLFAFLFYFNVPFLSQVCSQFLFRLTQRWLDVFPTTFFEGREFYRIEIFTAFMFIHRLASTWSVALLIMTRINYELFSTVIRDHLWNVNKFFLEKRLTIKLWMHLHLIYFTNEI